jgi:hypothetical protein
VDNPSRLSQGEVVLKVDGDAVRGNRFDVVDDGREHRVDAVLREPGAADEDAAVDRRKAQAAGGRR